jgi:hypothetical protein
MVRCMNAAGRPEPEIDSDGAPPTRPDEAIGRPVPDLSLPSSQDGTFSLRSRVGVGPLVLFFYIRNATPG